MSAPSMTGTEAGMCPRASQTAYAAANFTSTTVVSAVRVSDIGDYDSASDSCFLQGEHGPGRGFPLVVLVSRTGASVSAVCPLKPGEGVGRNDGLSVRQGFDHDTDSGVVVRRRLLRQQELAVHADMMPFRAPAGNTASSRAELPWSSPQTWCFAAIA